MTLDRIGREADQLDTPLSELGFVPGQSRKLCSAHWSIIFRVGEEDSPFITHPLVKVDHTGCRLGYKIGGDRSKAQTGATGQYGSSTVEGQVCPR